MSESTEVGIVSHGLVEGLEWPINGSDEVRSMAGGLQPVDDRIIRQAVNRDGKNRAVINSHQDLNSSI